MEITAALAKARQQDKANGWDTETDLIEALADEIAGNASLVAAIISAAENKLGADHLSTIIVDDAYETYKAMGESE